MTKDNPPRIAKVALVLSALVWIGTIGWAMTYLNSIDASPTNRPAQAPDDNTKGP
jgi:hypothetical protein